MREAPNILNKSGAFLKIKVSKIALNTIVKYKQRDTNFGGAI
jgi:hypothetical protein